ncbi:uncharacterized protein [Ambystoma mexicanum]|uniref:uncharacterized protein n=1 Tax=Ambystoma mexicanum TaxID=8296 RepID=UPI0037E8AF22
MAGLDEGQPRLNSLEEMFSPLQTPQAPPELTCYAAPTSRRAKYGPEEELDPWEVGGAHWRVQTAREIRPMGKDDPETYRVPQPEFMFRTGSISEMFSPLEEEKLELEKWIEDRKLSLELASKEREERRKGQKDELEDDVFTEAPPVVEGYQPAPRDPASLEREKELMEEFSYIFKRKGGRRPYAFRYGSEQWTPEPHTLLKNRGYTRKRMVRLRKTHPSMLEDEMAIFKDEPSESFVKLTDEDRAKIRAAELLDEKRQARQVRIDKRWPQVARNICKTHGHARAAMRIAKPTLAQKQDITYIVEKEILLEDVIAEQKKEIRHYESIIAQIEPIWFKYRALQTDIDAVGAVIDNGLKRVHALERKTEELERQLNALKTEEDIEDTRIKRLENVEFNHQIEVDQLEEQIKKATSKQLDTDLPIGKHLFLHKKIATSGANKLKRLTQELAQLQFKYDAQLEANAVALRTAEATKMKADQIEVALEDKMRANMVLEDHYGKMKHHIKTKNSQFVNTAATLRSLLDTTTTELDDAKGMIAIKDEDDARKSMDQSLCMAYSR